MAGRKQPDVMAQIQAAADAAKKKLPAPWKPIETMPSKKEVVICWLDDLGTWNIDFAWKQDGGQILHRNGMEFNGLVGWQPRPKLPGKARNP